MISSGKINGRNRFMKHRIKLIRQFAYLILVFVIVTITTTALVTYYSQMKQYKSMCKDRIMDVGDYLVGLLMEDPQDFLNCQEYYADHYSEIRIPVDFNDYTAARDEFFRVFHEDYPGMTYKVRQHERLRSYWITAAVKPR